MRIGEYKQITTEKKIVHHEAQKYTDCDEDGNQIVKETPASDEEVEVPVYGMVYRDATDEEIAEMEKMQAEMPEIEPTLEERITSLETEIASLKSYVNSIGKTELVGEGTADNPFTLTNGMELVPNAYYNYNGTRYVYMGSAEKWDGSDLSFENGWAEF